MLPQNRRILDQVVVWHTNNIARFADSVVEVALIGPSSGGSKDSVHVRFVGPLTLASVSFWDSGEWEIISMAMPVPDPNNAAVEIDLVKDEHEVSNVLDRLAKVIMASNGEDF